MAANDAIPYVLAAIALVIVARAIGRRPFVILGRRLSGRLPLRPPGVEPGAERWFALGGIVTFLGLAIAALVSREAGYSITAVGLLALSYTGVLIALDHKGAARTFVRRSWTEFGISVPAPLLQMRIIGVGMTVIGLAGAAIVLGVAFQ